MNEGKLKELKIERRRRLFPSKQGVFFTFGRSIPMLCRYFTGKREEAGLGQGVEQIG